MLAKAQSEVGGVVGGVIGSFADGEGTFPLSSLSPPCSIGSLDDDAELLGSLDQARLSMGRKADLGDRIESCSLEDDVSLGIRRRDRNSLGSCSWRCSSSCGATDAKKGPSTESFMSSYTILTASSSSDGFGGMGTQGSDSNRSRTRAGRLTSRIPQGWMKVCISFCQSRQMCSLPSPMLGGLSPVPTMLAYAVL